MKTMRVLLADDQTLFRKALASLLASRPNTEVVGEASDGEEALEKARDLKPDLVLMDIRMPRLDGLEATRILKQEFPEMKIVMLTVSSAEEDLFQAIKNGAQGFLSKNLRPETLFELLDGVSRGEAALSPTMAAKIMEEFVRQTHHRPQAAPSANSLTGREREVLQMMSQGATNKDIAVRLSIAEGTVKNHVHNILEKLHLQNRAQAATQALRYGLVPDLSPSQE